MIFDFKTSVPEKQRQHEVRFRQRVEYEHPGLGDDMQADTSKAKLEVATAKWVGTKLEFHYPGHAWHVQVRAGLKGRDGSIMIRLNGIMPANRCMHVKLSEALGDPGGREIMRRAGELLERYGLRRGNFNLDEWRQALNAMPIMARKTGRGHVAPLL